MSAPVRHRPVHGPSFGPGGVRFRLWAPDADEVGLVLGPDEHPMVAVGDGFFERHVEGVAPGADYGFRVGGRVVPDPAGRALASADVLGLSRLVDRSVFGRNRRLGRPWEEAVIAEVHVGTATPEGTFRALAGVLDRFVETGFTAIQLMPVAAFPGRFGWGYDGVLPFAPAPAYGSPEDLVDLVAAAHAHGLTIFQDVVYNHFGPHGNFLPGYAGAFFDPEAHTPWGAAIDFRRGEVRRFFVENAMMWLEDYGFDGLRFDAVHAYHPDGLMPFVRELAEEVRPLEPRPILVAENERNLSDILERGPDGAPLAFHAQWDDDVHNALHAALTGEAEGYYAGYARDPVALLARGLSEGFAWQGEPDPLHEGRPRGQPSGHLTPAAFVVFLQNHDQVGNRPVGDRLTEILRHEPLEVARLLLLLSPQIPMLFMGEDFSSRTRFPFFCDFTGELGEAVRAGRKREFAAFAGFSREIPDPVSEETFRSAKLDWSAAEGPEGSAVRKVTRDLLSIRRAHLVPLLRSGFLGSARQVAGRAFRIDWSFADGRSTIVANLAEEAARLPAGADAPPLADAPLAAVGSAHRNDEALLLGPWSAAFWVTT